MGNGYPVVPADDLAVFRQIVEQIQRRLRELEALDGSQVYDTLATLTDMVNNLATEIANVSSSGATWYGPVSAGTGTIQTTSGDIYTPHGRATPVVTSYVAAYLNSDGRLGATPSTRRLKRDIRTASWTREQRDRIRIVYYRLRAAYIMADMEGDADGAETLVGLIGEELLEAGLPEFVVLDERGRVFSVRYELLALVAIDGLQQVERDLDDLRDEVASLRLLIQSQRGGNPDADPEVQ